MQAFFLNFSIDLYLLFIHKGQSAEQKDRQTGRQADRQIGRLFIYLLKAYRPVDRSVTSGIFTKSNLTQVEYNTERARFTNVKHKKHNPKVSPFGIALIKKKRQMQLGDSGTIDRFGLAFQNQIKKIYKRMDKNNRNLKILCKI